MIKQISKTLYNNILKSRKRGYGVGMGRTVMLFLGKYYETTGASISEVGRFQQTEKKRHDDQLKLL